VLPACYPLLRRALFRMDTERAHTFTLSLLRAMQRTGAMPLLCARPVCAPQTVMGLHFTNAVGLAAGLDKAGNTIDALAALGFGFIEIGTVTPRPQPGNPAPRLFRLPQADAIINRMGFNNPGVDTLVRHVRATKFKGVLGINIGKNAGTPITQATQDYLHCLEKVYPVASYVAVNISSPNTQNLRQLQGAGALDTLLAALQHKRAQLADQSGKYVPLVLKIAPDLEEENIKLMAAALLRYGFDGVIATNTTLARETITGLPHASETGGLSGKPLFSASTRVIRILHAVLGDAIPIIGVGGIFSGADACEKYAAGAALVQLYTGLIYRGPALVRECALALMHAKSLSRKQ